ncbi:hypothetical protein, partial [Azorhizophilus paspali]
RRRARIGRSAWGWERCFCLATTNVPAHAGLFKPYPIDFLGKFLGITQDPIVFDRLSAFKVGGG